MGLNASNFQIAAQAAAQRTYEAHHDTCRNCSTVLPTDQWDFCCNDCENEFSEDMSRLIEASDFDHFDED